MISPFFSALVHRQRAAQQAPASPAPVRRSSVRKPSRGPLPPGDARFLTFMFSIHLRERLLNAFQQDAAHDRSLAGTRHRFAMQTADDTLKIILPKAPLEDIRAHLATDDFRRALRSAVEGQITKFHRGLRISGLLLVPRGEHTDAVVKVRGDLGRSPDSDAPQVRSRAPSVEPLAQTE